MLKPLIKFKISKGRYSNNNLALWLEVEDVLHNYKVYRPNHCKIDYDNLRTSPIYAKISINISDLILDENEFIPNHDFINSCPYILQKLIYDDIFLDTKKKVSFGYLEKIPILKYNIRSEDEAYFFKI